MKRLLTLIFILSFSNVSAVIGDIVSSIQRIRASSLRQEIIDFNKIIFHGDVEIWVDNKLHVWADKVEVNREKNTLSAYSDKESRVKLEGEDFLLLADHLFLNYETKSGFAENIKFHAGGRFVSAKRAEKLGEDYWKFYDILYTACDCPTPHWSFKASRAHLKKYVIYSEGLLFKLGHFPLIWVPAIAAPVQNQSRTGFLMPKFYYGKELGLGINQGFYWEIHPKVDTTLGMKWINKKGIVLYDEFRRGKGPESHTFVNSQMAFEKNAFKELERVVVKRRDHRYWIEGVNFETLTSKHLELNNLIRADFGTDKRIGFDFFSTTEAVEDEFNNNFVVRNWSPSNFVSFNVDGVKVFREQFKPEGEFELEIENNFKFFRAPRFEVNSGFYNFFKIFNYRHDFFIDSIFFKHTVEEKKLLNRLILESKEETLLPSKNTFRLYYEGRLNQSANVLGNNLSIDLIPNFQLRGTLRDSNIKAKKNVLESEFAFNGAYRLLLRNNIEWAFPEFSHINEKYAAYFQPILRWEHNPKFEQRHWYFVDEWDRIFAKNRIIGILNSNFYFDDVDVGLRISQAYEFNKRKNIFPLDRSSKQEHVLPTQINFSISYDPVHLSLGQEYDLMSGNLLQSEIDFTFNFKRVEFLLNWIYQRKNLQRTRELLSDIPAFANIGVAVPIFPGSKLSYSGHLFSRQDNVAAWITNPKILLHRIKYDYDGHCWGLSFGFEEKIFKQQGQLIGERQYFFSLRLESFGSFSKHIKREPIAILKAPDGY